MSVEDLFLNFFYLYMEGLLNFILVIDGEIDILKVIKGSVLILDNFLEGCWFVLRCLKVMDKCKMGQLEFVIYESGCFVRCFLYEEEGV